MKLKLLINVHEFDIDTCWYVIIEMHIVITIPLLAYHSEYVIHGTNSNGFPSCKLHLVRCGLFHFLSIIINFKTCHKPEWGPEYTTALKFGFYTIVVQCNTRLIWDPSIGSLYLKWSNIPIQVQVGVLYYMGLTLGYVASSSSSSVCLGSYRWLSARLQHLQCVGNGYIALLH